MYLFYSTQQWIPSLEMLIMLAGKHLYSLATVDVEYGVLQVDQGINGGHGSQSKPGVIIKEACSWIQRHKYAFLQAPLRQL
jgi:hypothetical protein